MAEVDIYNALKERHGEAVQEKIKNASVAIAGLGGLGSNIALSLARCGVGYLLLVDFDKVDVTNINRQQYFIEQIGMYKTDAISETIKRINPYIKIDTVCEKVSEENAAKIFGGYEVVCEAFDEAQNKAMLINTLLQNTNATVVAASGMAGFLSSNSIKTMQKMKKLYICGDLETDAKAVNGLMAPRVTICANHQANMVLRLLCGETDA